MDLSQLLECDDKVPSNSVQEKFPVLGDSEIADPGVAADCSPRQPGPCDVLEAVANEIADSEIADPGAVADRSPR